MDKCLNEKLDKHNIVLIFFIERLKDGIRYLRVRFVNEGKLIIPQIINIWWLWIEPSLVTTNFGCDLTSCWLLSVQLTVYIQFQFFKLESYWESHVIPVVGNGYNERTTFWQEYNVVIIVTQYIYLCKKCVWMFFNISLTKNIIMKTYIFPITLIVLIFPL